MATYLAAAALDQLEQAQALLERHLAAGPDGRCLTCGQVESCQERAWANGVILRYGRLPRRRPGAAAAKRRG